MSLTREVFRRIISDDRETYVLAKSHGQAEQGSYLVAHSCAARFVYLSASHFCSVKNGTLQFWNSILLYIGLYVAKFVFSLRLVPLPLVQFPQNCAHRSMSLLAGLLNDKLIFLLCCLALRSTFLHRNGRKRFL